MNLVVGQLPQAMEKGDNRSHYALMRRYCAQHRSLRVMAEAQIRQLPAQTRSLKMDGDARSAQIGRTRQRYDAIYGIIRQRISLLDYEPGRRLSEEVLAEEFGVSRTPLRRVLARLESEGLLRSVQSVGTIVTDVDLETLSQTYRLRMELAEFIGRLDPPELTDAIIEPIRATLARFDEIEHPFDARSFAEINIDFLHAILNLTENEPFREISERLYFRTARIWIKSIDAMNFAEELAIFRREVDDVLAAVETGDIAAVGHIRRSHISMSYHRLRRKRPTG